MSRLRGDIILNRIIRTAAVMGTCVGFAWCVAVPLAHGDTRTVMSPGHGVLATAPAFFALATLVNAALAMRRVGASWVGAVLVGVSAAMLTAIIAWLLVFWMRLDGGIAWRTIGWTGLGLLLLGNLGVGRWAASVRQLPTSPANFHVGA